MAQLDLDLVNEDNGPARHKNVEFGDAMISQRGRFIFRVREVSSEIILEFSNLCNCIILNKQICVSLDRIMD